MKDNNGFVNLLESIAERSPIKAEQGDYKEKDRYHRKVRG